MKALIIVTVLAMATSAIAVPLSRQAKAQAFLAAMQDNAKMEGWLGDIGNAIVKYGPTVLKTGLALGGAALWDEELDREVATVQMKNEEFWRKKFFQFGENCYKLYKYNEEEKRKERFRENQEKLRLPDPFNFDQCVCQMYNMKTNTFETKQIVRCEEIRKLLGASLKNLNWFRNDDNANGKNKNGK